MATKHKKGIGAVEVTAFSGMDASSPYGDVGCAYDMKNFKVLADGSLCTRDGFAVLAALPEEVRAVRVVRAAGGDVILAVAGTVFYRISAADGSMESGEIAVSASGKLCFFDYDGELYLMDGTEIYRYAGGLAFEVAAGYVPLYGKNWTPNSEYNTVNEPINLLSRYLRITMNQLEVYYTLRLGVKAASVAVFNDGRQLGEDECYLSDDGMTIIFGRDGVMPQAPYTEIHVTLDDSYWHDAAFRSCASAAHYDSFSTKRVFLYGGERGEALYISRPVGASSMAASAAMDAASTSLYFPRGYEVSFGDGQPIKAVRRLWDRMMICTADGTWLTDSVGAGDISVRPMSQTMGCSSQEGLVLIDGDVPVTVSAGGLFRWTIDPSAEWACSRVCFSDEVAAHLGDGFFECARMYYAASVDELWLFRPGDEEGRVFIYDCTRRRWYSYVGIRATAVFEADGRIGFAGGGEICLFDGALTADACSFGEREIVGVFESRRADLGDGEAVKRAVRVFAEADTAGGELAVGLYDGGLLGEVTFSGAGCHSSHINTPRFGRLSVVLRASGVGRKRVYGVCLHVRA